ncbi:MAG: serine/threonine protein kinase, partial [Alkalinema sp. CACIAM 70d]
IGLQISDILHELCQYQIVHKDIKPANLLIHPESKQVKLIDFSIASLLPKETQTLLNPNVLEGTLAYLAPEQTGRMNRAIDYRTDFYAFGVTLYQLLTGQLPFASEDPLELIHCHIAQQPMPADQVNPAVPPMLARIVAKLMAKNAEDRYQSALGLKHDLKQCLEQWHQTGAIPEFSLAQRDISDRFSIPEKLYGREQEVQTLLDAFARIAEGHSELMLVAGFSGIGKTAVINEVHKPIVKQRGYFIKGKFDQFNRNIPFSAFVQAFRDLVAQLLSESDTQLHTWKSQILDALGDNAQVIVDLIPELDRILGPQPPAPELSGTAAQNRFNLLFQRFIHVFTTADHPLVMFIDDLQWADLASLNLIRVLMAEAKTGYLLLLGAYRDNEVFAAHPLMLTLDDLAKAGAVIQTLTLKPLSDQSLNQLVAETLHTTESVAQPLTELVMQKTQGNPFFATQFLKVLHQEQLITFDRDAGHWQCEIGRVRDAALTDDVVEFMARQLQKLPEVTQDILKLAACIGAQFDLDTLAIVAEQSQTEVANALWQALQEGLILP